MEFKVILMFFLSMYENVFTRNPERFHRHIIHLLQPEMVLNTVP